MRRILLFVAWVLCMAIPAMAQKESKITLHTDQAKQLIPKEIYGQFAEHLGTCIYGG
ncbi:MAG: alpha-N-arabinofuranosidase, partial [Paraprevotella sp.]|nr:alpha-N-arabinofuranosidase [Paraprevotella sp.]